MVLGLALGLAREPIRCAHCKADIHVTVKASFAVVLVVCLFVLVLFCASIPLGALISSGYHANPAAAIIWSFGGLFAISAGRIWKEAGQRYFDGRSGLFKPVYTKRSRIRVLSLVSFTSAAIIGFGVLVQVFA
jgi:hypothetical protein